MHTFALRRLLCCAAAALFALSTQAAPEDDFRKTMEQSLQAAKPGPQDVPLAGQALLKLPSGYSFVPQPQAGRMLNAMGNPGHDERLQGLILPENSQDWFMTVRFEASGFVKDDDARNWDAEDLLKSYREGTEASNAERVKMGAPALEILGWAEKPIYDAANHRLAWAMSSRAKGAPESQPQGVNYNTYVLGREGYFSMNLVTGLADLPAHRPAAQTMLGALSFNSGKTYNDFNPGTDHVAAYGLAALVLGVGAKKLGLLAVAGLFFAKFAKLIILGLAGVGALAFKVFRRKPQAPAAGS